MDYAYAITPFIAWLVAGSLKFIINSVRAGDWAFGHIGYGGMPSNHSAIVSSTASLIALREGIQTPAFGVAVTLAFIVVMDANSLRRQIGKHAKAINELAKETGVRPEESLRERMGHSTLEILVGLFVGYSIAKLIIYL
ncbi:MAG: divergent PAP2 family protein [Gammaproteobacteria bacterium]|nr:divergent PAP2 family protein [Gammaproteobacteria bacterium]NBY21720.1 divergent PAP2 family protein [Gammaproteobacteria bacterium]